MSLNLKLRAGLMKEKPETVETFLSRTGKLEKLTRKNIEILAHLPKIGLR
jgi:hypothetical protein